MLPTAQETGVLPNLTVGKAMLLNAHTQLLARGKKEVENVKIRTSEKKYRKQRE